MKEKKSIRQRWLTIRLRKEEEAILLSYVRKTTCRSLSEYARSVLLKAPVIVRYRNASADDFLEEMVRLKGDLKAVEKNFNEAIQRLRTIEHAAVLQLWLLQTEHQRAELVKKTDEILQKATQIHRLWSRE